MNTLFKILSAFITAFALQSCSSYIRFFDIKKVPNEEAMQSRVFELPADTITMQFFGDYCFEKTKTVKKHLLTGRFMNFTSTEINF